MFKKLILGVVALLSLTLLVFPLLTSADGMLIAPPDRYIFESNQKGVIFFANGEERLILSTSFRGDANDFAWIIPSPSKPEVKKSSAEIFTSLQSLTGSNQVVDLPMASMGLGLSASKGVQVIEQKSIEYYDIAVLSADDKNALASWLNTNGYHFPEQYSYVLQSYIDNNWIFTAVKFKNDIGVALNASMRDGNLIPLELKFKTDRPVYPLKISSVIEEPNNKVGPNYVNGLNDQALELSTESKLYLLRKPYDINQGSVEMWVKINQNDTELSHVDLFAAYNSSDFNKKINFVIDGKALFMQLNDQDSVQYSPSVWTAGSKLSLGDNWNYLVVTWKEGEAPKFYLNSILISTVPDSILFPKISDNATAKDIYIGRDQFSGALKSIYIDQVRLSANVRTEQEILDSYNNGLGKELVYDNSTVLTSSFNGNNRYTDKDGDLDSFVYREIYQRPQTNYYKPSQIGIELYIFTPDKEQTLPGFTTAYASWLDKKTIENLAMDDNGQPILKLDKDKYYLTKLTRQMKYEEMTNDLFFRDAAANSDSGTEGKSKTPFYIIITLAGLISLTIIGIIIFKNNRD